MAPSMSCNKTQKTLIEGLDRPYGLAFWKDYLYVAETTSLKRYKYDAKAMTVGSGEEIVPMKDFGKGHVTRTVAVQPQGRQDAACRRLLSQRGRPATRRCARPSIATIPMAAVTRSSPQALAIRLGLRFYPGTDDLWAAVQERDGLGEDLVPDYFTRIAKARFYGWPYAYIGRNEDPRITEKRPDLVDKTIVPDVILAPHVAVLDFIFYTGKQFPAAVPRRRIPGKPRLLEPRPACGLFDHVCAVQRASLPGRRKIF